MLGYKITALEKGLNGEKQAKRDNGFDNRGWEASVVTVVALPLHHIQHPFSSLSNFSMLKLA